MDNFEIIDYDPDNPKHIESIGTIHGIVLPESNVPGLGKLFMNKFYYKTLPELGLLKCFFACSDSKIVGLIVTNKAPFSLIKQGMKKNTLKLMLIVGLSVLLNPLRLKFLFSQLRYKPDPLLKNYEDSGIAFEILTIGVLKHCRNIRFGDNKKISHRMVDHAITCYKKEGYKYITGQILKTNVAALKLYRAYEADYIDSSVRNTGVIMEIDLDKITKRA